MRQLLTAAAGLLAGCAVGPDYAPPPLPTPAAFTAAPADATAAATPGPWWHALDCEQLSRLVDLALENNVDLRVAAARIAAARALAGVAAGAEWPRVDGTGGWTRTHTTAATPSPLGGRTYSTWTLGFDASWEIDLFGRLRREHEARQAELDLAEADRLGVVQGLAAEVVVTFAELSGAERRRTVALASIAAAEELVALTAARARSGFGTDLDTARAERLLASNRARLPQLQAALVRSANRLAVLLGLPPEAVAAALQAQPAALRVPGIPAPGLPAELIRRRPDVAAAERRLAAATARLGATLADRFPRLSIGGFFGLEADRSGDLFESSSRALRGGPSLRLPLFTGGTVGEQIAVREAQIDEARNQLERSVLRAFEEVENGLVGMREEQRRIVDLDTAVGAAERVRTFAQQRFDAGLTDFLAVLDAEQARLDLADQREAATVELVRQFAALHKALGS